MFRSISTRSSGRMKNNNESVISTERRKSIPMSDERCLIKKAFSLILNTVDSAICSAADDTEMLEFVRYSNSEENLNTIHRSTSTVSDNTIINQRSLFPHRTCATTMHRTLSQLKNKFIHRHECTDNNYERNNGFLVVDTPDSEPVLVSDDTNDHQQTQHAQPCVQENDTNFDLNQIQYSSVIPNTPNSSPPPETLVEPSVPRFSINVNYELEAQSTRSGIECGVTQADLIDIHDTQASSTNSSTHEYTGRDRSELTDNEYVQAQLLDLECLINFEISLFNECHGLKLELEEQSIFNGTYDEALEQNFKLKQELFMLQEEYNRFYSPWSCELCTFLNQPYNDTRCDTCEVCESPSPLKRATLIK